MHGILYRRQGKGDHHQNIQSAKDKTTAHSLTARIVINASFLFAYKIKKSNITTESNPERKQMPYHNSKTRQPRWWKKWNESGSIGTCRKKPEFFLYYGQHSMRLNTEVMKNLTEKDLILLSEPELAFYRYWKESGLIDIHSGSCVGPQPSQEEFCEYLMANFATSHKSTDIPISELI